MAQVHSARECTRCKRWTLHTRHTVSIEHAILAVLILIFAQNQGVNDDSLTALAIALGVAWIIARFLFMAQVPWCEVCGRREELEAPIEKRQQQIEAYRQRSATTTPPDGSPVPVPPNQVHEVANSLRQSWSNPRP